MVGFLRALGGMSFQLPSIFQQSGFNASTGNGTGPTDARGPAASFPAGVMDSFLATAGQASPLMQVFFFVYRMLGSHLGLDPSVLLTLLGFFWALSKIGSQIYAHILDLIDRHFMCAIFVSEHDHIYSHVMKWLSQQPSIRNSQYLAAQTVWKSAWEEEEDLESALFFTDGGDGDSDRKYLNFSNQAARSVRVIFVSGWEIALCGTGSLTMTSSEPQVCSCNGCDPFLVQGDLLPRISEKGIFHGIIWVGSHEGS